MRVSNSFSVWREYSEVFKKVGPEDTRKVVVLASGLDKPSRPVSIVSVLYALYFVTSLIVLIIAVSSGLSVMPANPVDAARVALYIGHHIREFQYAIAAPERRPFPVIVATTR